MHKSFKTTSVNTQNSFCLDSFIFSSLIKKFCILIDSNQSRRKFEMWLASKNFYLCSQIHHAARYREAIKAFHLMKLWLINKRRRSSDMVNEFAIRYRWKREIPAWCLNWWFNWASASKNKLCDVFFGCARRPVNLFCAKWKVFLL